MCGIAGVMFWRDMDVSHAQAAVEAMVARLSHRGPDGHAVRSGARGAAGAVFGHTRLAIIDLSERAAQPMVSATGQVMLAFNGEIYNFAEIRAALEAVGRRFRSDSDTEVILQGYEEWGAGVVARLRGMFAFAIWDGVREELLLARDRLGIKPLYVYRGRGLLAFASEIRSLLASGLVPATLDPIALDGYLTHQTVPTPRTLIRDVRTMEPGHIAAVNARGEMSTHAYWNLLDSSVSDGQPSAGASAGEVRARVHDLLVEATRLHLVSDVPVGLFLSGGIDSSALVSLVRETGIVPRTFAVAFPGTRYDESRFARAVAADLGSDHVEIPLTEQDVLSDLRGALDAFDHPSGDAINTYVVSKAVRAAGIKVALSGLGGDEFFGGYPTFQRMPKIARYEPVWKRVPPSMRAAAARVVSITGRHSVAATKRAALVAANGTFAETYPLLRQLFLRARRVQLLGEDRVLASEAMGDPYVTLLSALPPADARHMMSRISYAEARTYMHDVLLRDTDQMSMRHGLEVRVPFLDHKLVEFLMALPDGAKTVGRSPKGLLLESMRRPLPDAAVNRPKQGFLLPFDQWMRGELRPLCEQHLAALAERAIFRKTAVQQLWREFVTGQATTTWARPWALIALDAWMDRNGVST